MDHQHALAEKGFTILPPVYSSEAIRHITGIIEAAGTENPSFRKTADLFAIRRVLQEIPALRSAVFTPALLQWADQLSGPGYFMVKSIYFDKPGASNWFVSYHQDLTISVNTKTDIAGFGPWTVKEQQYAVQPPLHILQNMFTLRIHLDETDENNGALRVIPGSHRKEIYRAADIDWQQEAEETCCVPQGGVMVMKPLLLHASGRTTNGRNRRVLHIEFCNCELPAPLQWAERININ